MPRYCLTFDLQDDPKKIAEYKRRHEKIWPEVRDSLFAAGILAMEIYLTGTPGSRFTSGTRSVAAT